MSTSLRVAPRLRPVWTCASTPARAFTSTAARQSDSEKWPQRIPLGPYYDLIIKHPQPLPFDEKPEEPPSSADPDVLPPGRKPKDTIETPAPRKNKPGRKPKSPPSSSVTTDPKPPQPPSSSNPSLPKSTPPTSLSAQERARFIFGSPELKALDEAERLATKTAQSTYVAGVLVPPRPEEPDNCCMSGCVNCVYEAYRDDLEEWAAKKNEAVRRVRAGEGDAAAAPSEADKSGGAATATPTASPKVGDEGITKNLWDDEAMRSLPVGIQQFMKMEKLIKERHAKETSADA